MTHPLTYALANTNQQSLIFSTSFREIPSFAAYFVFHVSFCLLIIKNRGLPVIVTGYHSKFTRFIIIGLLPVDQNPTMYK